MRWILVVLRKVFSIRYLVFSRSAPNTERRILILTTLLLLLTGCTTEQTPSVFRTAGRISAEINTLTTILLILGTIGFVVPMAVLAYGLFGKRREDNLQRIIIWGGIVFPVILLVITYVFTITTFRVVTAYDDDPLIIEVTGNQYWWEITYPAYNVESANEIHIPVDRPIELHLTSNDVYHAFWLPELGVKRDLVPGETNTYQFEANIDRMYWGLCSEFCGIQHANMLLVVVAHEQAAFEKWVAQQQQGAPEPVTEEEARGLEVFFSAECHRCHAINGTDAVGNAGPDLTHLASRITLGAGATHNSVGTLGGWVANPHGIKPGVHMPAANISGAELNALLAYLQTLK